MRVVVMCAAVCAVASAGFAQSFPTAFAYQGRINDGAQVANGLYDFEFRLFGVATGGVQLGPISCSNNVLVTDGLFTTTVDFGQQYAPAGQRFIEVALRADGGLDCTNESGFVVLAPRLMLPNVPVAAHAKSAFVLDVPNGSHPNLVVVNNDGNVGVGTTNPAAPLHLVTPGEGVRIQGNDVGDPNLAWIGFYNLPGSRIGYVGDGTIASSGMYLGADSGDVHLYSSNPSSTLAVTPNGNVGIGTGSPITKLDVRGDISFGASGQYFVAGSSGNLRVIYGVVTFDGLIESGPEFTVAHPSNGRYNITFNPPFNGVPTVTATVINSQGGSAAFNMISLVTQSGVNLEVFRNSDGSFYNQGFQFIAIGPR